MAELAENGAKIHFFQKKNIVYDGFFEKTKNDGIIAQTSGLPIATAIAGASAIPPQFERSKSDLGCPSYVSARPTRRPRKHRSTL